ncbi:hypothetical protein M1M07_14120 [Rhodococcus sp. HM1]|uniref:hypothetical protein n=1 Tax=Rhodococcus sp. HM1 TaxID=2937759 RepID=UPI00200AE8E8|nr:hypothetical protein [Rhodococcus sp. HM1]MCK8672236.1 hypothetical protein [Rhodococcus sp. HM1]
MPIDRARLKIHRELGSGGFGTVYEVDTPNALLSEPTCAFKEFKDPGNAEIQNVQVLVAHRASMSNEDREILDKFTTWPLEVVTKGRAVVGFLMRMVPQDFMEKSIAQVNRTTSVLRSIDWLANPVHARNSGASLVVEASDIKTRLRYCAWLSRVFHFLHRNGMVYGDLSLTNVLYSDSRDNPVMVIDTDPVRVEAVSPLLVQATSPGMRPPEARGANATTVQDVKTDRFKLAVLLYNVLGASMRIDSKLSAVQGKIDSSGMQMFAAALGSDRDRRPSAEEWYRYFYGRYTALIDFPKIANLEIEPRHGLAGQSVTVRWTVQGQEALTLHTPWGVVHDLSVSAPDSLQVTLQSSGQFRLVATNSNGSTEMASEVVHVFTPPRIDFVEVPELQHVSRMVTGLDLEPLDRLLEPERNLEWVDDLLHQVTPPPIPDVIGDPSIQVPDIGKDLLSADGLARALTDAMDMEEWDIRWGPVRASLGTHRIRRLWKVR